jgi:hypothetical protein
MMMSNAKRSFLVLLILLGMAAFAAPAMADWVEGMPAKWVQLPDLTDTGMDVNATFRPSPTGQGGAFPFAKVLADDFQCTEPGFITDIHIWGSWLNNQKPTGFSFPIKLSIHADVPKGPNNTYSYPATPALWEKVFNPGEYLERPWATAHERFYEPNTNQVIGFDDEVFQYNFMIPPALQFFQEGTLTAPKVYWLDVQAMLPEPFVFGWKTSKTQWNDDAVFADTDVFAGPPVGPAPAPIFWRDMHDPATGASIDMSFVVNSVPEPGTIVMLIGAGVVGLGLLIRRRAK